MNFGDPRLDSRIWDKVIPEPNSGCWIWLAALNSKGYASLWDPDRRQMVGAHRFAYEVLVELVPKDLDLDHKCRLECCINPDHLEPVTRSVNVARGDTGKLRGSVGHRNRLKTACPLGHPLSEENIYKDRNGWRRCRICHLAQAQKYRKKLLTPDPEVNIVNSLDTETPDQG